MDQGRHANIFPQRARFVDTACSQSLHSFAKRRTGRSDADAGGRFGLVFTGRTNRWFIRPRFRDFRPEKRYQGGQANTLYIYDLATNDAKKISDDPHAARDAMWIGGTIYYNSDRDGKFNLWAYDTRSAKRPQVTQNRDWDIRWPSSDDQGQIVYEKNGELEIFDVSTKKG